MSVAVYYTRMFSLYEIDNYKKWNDYLMVLEVQGWLIKTDYGIDKNELALICSD